MKKRLLPLLLVLALCLSLTSAALAAPRPKSKTMTLEETYVYSEVGSVSVKVTYTGWLGEIEAKYSGVDELYRSGWYSPDHGMENRPIQVIEAGSEVRFTITASDPAAYYNFCFDRGEFDMYTFDDCGGGCLYVFQDGVRNGYDYFVIPNGDGTADYRAAGFLGATGEKTGTRSYSITVDEGMMTLAFNGKDPEDYSNHLYEARYLLGTVLAIGEEQEAAILAGEAPTFHRGTFLEYSYVFPGLASLYGMEEPEPLYPGFGIYFEDSDGSLMDNGVLYSYSVQNNTAEDVTGPYLLATYRTTKNYDYQYPYLQLFSFDLDLQTGERLNGQLTASTWGVEDCELTWLKFEDEAERSAFLSDNRLVYDPQTNSHVLNFGAENKISVEAADGWFREKLGVTFEILGIYE